MSGFTLRLPIAVCGAILFSFPLPAEAQIVRRFAGRRAVAPLARVHVGPYGGVSIRAPLVAIDIPGGRFLARRRFVQDPAAEPAPGNNDQPQAARPWPQPAVARSVPAYLFPTSEELAALDDAALLGVLRDAQSRLTQRLTRFDTGAGWRRHLGFDVDAMADFRARVPVIHVDALRRSLARFDKVADNPNYATISRLPSFAATQLALREMAARYDGPQFTADPEHQPADNLQEEILPGPVAEPSATRGEHSILKRR